MSLDLHFVSVMIVTSAYSAGCPFWGRHVQHHVIQWFACRQHVQGDWCSACCVFWTAHMFTWRPRKHVGHGRTLWLQRRL